MTILQNKVGSKTLLISVVLVLVIGMFLGGTNSAPIVVVTEQVSPTEVARDLELIESQSDNPAITKALEDNVRKTLAGFVGGFLRNIGQHDAAIRFSAQSPGMAAGFGTSEVRFRVANPEPKPSQAKELPTSEESNSPKSYTTLAVDFPGSNDVIPVAEKPSGVSSHYYRGREQAQWADTNPYYQRLVYYNIYEQIDLVYEITNNQLKYEFIVHPGGQLQQIQVHWTGDITLDLVPGEGMRVKTLRKNREVAATVLVDSSPIVYQSQARKIPLTASFELVEATTYGFRVPTYDATKLVIIDPVISLRSYTSYSTYVGGSNADYGKAIAVDNSGNAYVTGHTYSTDFPTLNAYDATGDGTTSYYDVLVFKLAADGRSLLYSTYVGGDNYDFGQGIAVDSVGNAYITGETRSTDFPTVNAYNTTGDGTNSADVFVLKLAADGSTLLYSTYVGGSDNDYGRGIAVDSAGNAYVAAETISTDFPTLNAYDAVGDGSTSYYDVLVFKLAANGSSLLYSTYVGGSNTEYGKAIAVDNSGNAYVTGETFSTDFPTTPNAYNTTGDGSMSYYDVVVFKLAADGRSLLYSTYVGGSNHDYGRAIAVDSAGNAYVTGETYSTDFPLVNAYDAVGDGSTSYYDVLVFKLAADGRRLLYSTYVGGSRSDLGRGIAVDWAGNAYVTGSTYSLDFPTLNANNATGDGSTSTFDVVVFKLSPEGSTLLYSTYVGGSHDDIGLGIAVDSAGNAYVSGGAQSPNFPTVNAYNATGDGNTSTYDGVVFKLSPEGYYLDQSTYVAGSHHEGGRGIAVDSAGNAYVTGSTYSTNFPAVNAYNATGDGNSGFSDVFVFKLATDGRRLLYSTYVGGSRWDNGWEIAVDSAGNAYVTGETYSIDFPTSVNAFNATGDGSISTQDIFVFKLAADGRRLLYSTYVGGSDHDLGYGIAVDSTGNAYVTGGTYSTDFPTSVNAYNATGDGSTSTYDVVVFKLAANGSSLLYSTYVGGSDDDVGLGIAVDGAGNAYVTGYTDSIDFPTVNAYNATGDGSISTNDAVVFKLAASGNSLLYSTYVGGSNDDWGQAIVVDNAGNAYITGSTNSIDYPAVHAYNATGDGSTSYYDMVVFKLAADGRSLLYSTYVGGSNDDRGQAIAVDSAGNAYITGYTNSIDFPILNAYDGTGDASTTYYDAVVFKLATDGRTLLYSTYVGGNQHDYGEGIAVDNAGNAYIAGETWSTDFPTLNAYNATGDGSAAYSDVVVFKITYYSKPSPPTELTSAISADQRVILIWRESADDGHSPVIRYRLYRSTSSQVYGSFLGETTDKTFIDPTAVPGITYYYVVTAINNIGESLFSNEVTVTVTSPITQPDSPQNLTISPGDNFAELTWAPPSTDGGSPITSYRVYRGTSSGFYTLIGVVTASSNFNDTTVVGGTTYYYVVTAVNVIGESTFSNEVSVVPSGTPPTGATVSSAPQSLAATPGDIFVELSWTAPSTDGGSSITSYRVYRGTTSGLYTLIGVVTASLSFTDTTVTGGTTYYYVVTAVNAVGESGFSNEASVTTADISTEATKNGDDSPGFTTLFTLLGLVVVVILVQKRKTR
ncbi:MAG: SBBP repeat-containing protein [Candidatus Heimdallarchaeota archaeon]